MRNGWIAALLASGCDLGTPALVEGFEEDLTEVRSCGDLRVFAFDDDDEIMLGISVDGLLADSGGEEVQTVLTLPDPSIAVRVEVGAKISDAACDDVIENGGPRVSETWSAVSGTVTVDVRTLDPATYQADVQLEDVVFESPDGERVTVEELGWTELSIGWLPG